MLRRMGLRLHPRDGPQDRGPEHLELVEIRTTELLMGPPGPPAVPGRLGKPIRGAGGFSGHQKE